MEKRYVQVVIEEDLRDALRAARVTANTVIRYALEWAGGGERLRDAIDAAKQRRGRGDGGAGAAGEWEGA